MFFRTKAGGVQWIVAFLGNPGSEYAKTRHNVGFMTADIIEKQANIKINRHRFSAMTTTATLGGETALLLKPQTYMNLSGKSVAPAAAFYKIPADRIIVVCDDVALPTGKLRIREKGTSGGHNGLKSIIAALGTDEFPRIKIGVGAPVNDSERALPDWVLGKLTGKDAETIGESCAQAASAVTAYISEGAARAMNIFN